MDDKKKKKPKHGRHAAPEIPKGEPKEEKVAAASTPATSAPAASASAASTPAASTPDAPKDKADQAASPEAPEAGKTAVMPQPVRPVGTHPGGTQPAAPGFVPAGPMLPVDVDAEAARGHKPLKVVGIVLGIFAGLLLIVYAAGAFVFMDRFLPRTTVGDMDVSFKSSAEVQQQLANAIDDYVLKVSGQGFSLTLSAKDAGMKLDGKAVTDAMHAAVNPWAWPLEITRAHDETEKIAATYNESGLGDAVRAAVDEFNKTAEGPVNATIAFNEVKAAFVVQPEKVGTALDYDAVIKAVDDAVIALNPSVKLTEAELQQPSVLSTDAKLAHAADKANTMLTADMVLTMAGSTAGEVNAGLIAQWVRLGEDLSATLDEGALTAWVDELVNACNTVGTTRTYTRPDGKVITVSGGVYGWSVDRDALLGIVKDGVATGRKDTVEVPCTTTGTAYNGAGARDWGNRYLDIDLAEQYVRFYDEAGTLIWESPCISGTPDGVHDTNVGVFWLNGKASPSKLTGYEGNKKIYDTTVQYWMPFVGNAIGLHDADWQVAFGGTLYANGAGSHGCVNLPPYKAAELYNLIQSGDTVVSHW